MRCRFPACEKTNSPLPRKEDCGMATTQPSQQLIPLKLVTGAPAHDWRTAEGAAFHAVISCAEVGQAAGMPSTVSVVNSCPFQRQVTCPGAVGPDAWLSPGA